MAVEGELQRTQVSYDLLVAVILAWLAVHGSGLYQIIATSFRLIAITR
jgi:hypothetical protein